MLELLDLQIDEEAVEIVEYFPELVSEAVDFVAPASHVQLT